MTRTWRLLLAGALVGWGAASFVRLDAIGAVPAWARAPAALLALFVGLVLAWWNGEDAR